MSKVSKSWFSIFMHFVCSEVIRGFILLILLKPFHPTLEDVYDANVNTDRGTVENLRFYDTEGIESKNSSNLSEKLPKHLFSVADGVVIVYSIDDESSFQIAEVLRKEAEKHKEKKEVRLHSKTKRF